ncbi:glycosyltransferase family 4 protein [Synechococcus sp. 1G10]|uniref:glycosyltransferase family 4 protein n=1 Tax=Synechococcus sp. 1G10 TaxID=2025605 RepID=UPI000B98F064|nr:glycosyltransferase family 4 protein [Synechococcus sp. 1G10]
MNALLALHRIGPYHDARFQAALAHLDLEVLETRPHSQEYPWSFQPAGTYRRHALHGAAGPEQDPHALSLERQLSALLDGLQPDVVLTVGWADRAYRQLLRQAQLCRIPVVLIADSRWRDRPRQRLQEWSKRLLLRHFSAALVAGRESRSYLEGLGFPPPAIFQPWDVVDNAFFAAEAARARGESAPPPLIGQHHLICVGRAIPEKNLDGLLDGYAAYQHQGGGWGLRLIGSGGEGPQAGPLRKGIARLPRPEWVRLEPFLDQHAVARAYGLASALVLPSRKDTWGLVVNEAMAAGLPVIVSTACGCAADLITPGETGWLFDPADPAQLSAALHRAEAQPPPQRAAMVAAARRRLEAFSLAAFAGGLKQAVHQAYRHPRVARGAASLALALACRLEDLPIQGRNASRL